MPWSHVLQEALWVLLRLQMPLKLVLAVRETVAGHRLDALQGMHPCPAPPPPPQVRGKGICCTSRTGNTWSIEGPLRRGMGHVAWATPQASADLGRRDPERGERRVSVQGKGEGQSLSESGQRGALLVSAGQRCCPSPPCSELLRTAVGLTGMAGTPWQSRGRARSVLHSRTPFLPLCQLHGVQL